MGMFILLMKNRTAVLNMTSVGSRLMLRNSAMSACNVVEANSSASQISRLRPLPTTDKLRPLPPPPQRTVRRSVTPQLRTGDEPAACSVWLAQLASSAPKAIPRILLAASQPQPRARTQFNSPLVATWFGKRSLRSSRSSVEQLGERMLPTLQSFRRLRL